MPIRLNFSNQVIEKYLKLIFEIKILNMLRYKKTDQY